MRLIDYLPADRDADLLDPILKWVEDKKLSLYPAQEEAILELLAGKNVILETPTGSGKSLVAMALCFASLAAGRRCFYTSPIKALVGEKFFDLCRELGPERVGLMTGDASVNTGADVICCTAEILASHALREGDNLDIGEVVMDEFHYYGDVERGVAWQVPLLTLPQARFLLMSATLGPTETFERGLTELTGAETVKVRSGSRPVPLSWEYRETPLHETIAEALEKGRAPIYLVSFTQREAAEHAQDLMSVDVCSKDEKKRILDELQGARFTSPYGKEFQRMLKHGVGIHHAGLLPRYRLLVERLAQKGLLKVISGTDTLGVGVNVPIRSVLLTKLCKYDGEKTAILKVRDFHQICGRAGRKGFDDEGFVYAQAPEHVVENLKMEKKAAADPSKRKKMVKAKPPEKGFVPWDAQTFDRLRAAEPEPLISRFRVSHGMLLSVLGREEGGCAAMKSLLKTNHESAAKKRALGHDAMSLVRSLYDAKVLELVPKPSGAPGKTLVVHADLQLDFSLNQALSLFVVETMRELDPSAPDYALDVLSLVEAVCEDPSVVLMKQLDKLKSAKMAEMKADGVEYEERIAELERMENPKPKKDFIYERFNIFREKEPWVGTQNVRPKSIAREMNESVFSFSEYVRELELQRAEGVLLRYLSEVYRALVQTVPTWAKTDDVRDVEEYLRLIVQGTDSSLLDEWERLRNPERVIAAVPMPAKEEPFDLTKDRRAFTVLVRNECFRLVRAIARGEYEAASELLDGTPAAPALQLATRPYFEAHPYLRTDADARSPARTRIEEDGDLWRVEQVLVDDDDDCDFALLLTVDLAKCREAGRVVLAFDRLGA